MRPTPGPPWTVSCATRPDSPDILEPRLHPAEIRDSEAVLGPLGEPLEERGTEPAGG
ncbi:hypothetical protein KIK06_09980 [Nocardiopsis sp. EMB25]|uniref:hypothetical protein n=1 Tax=Nocardiopsis sp. EMB25 TaxID=2835867 RepID=UPI00228484A7|nr:hypothetical protein [Nocardiopsis sp. EMB25]MCY9784221.1 hypothetical protein [Nocardiopsis sp. EMB25]